jgi:hypothetical protein
MLNTITQASQNFCTHQIGISCEIKNTISQKRTLIAYIDIDTKDDKKYRVYIASELAFMQRVSLLFLEEDDSDEETLIDMALETVNLIVGSAKVIYEESSDNPYIIETPHFYKIDVFNEQYDEALAIKIDEDEMIIAIKELI